MLAAKSSPTRRTTMLQRAFTTKAGLLGSGLNGKGEPTYHPRSVPVKAGDAAFAVYGPERQTGQTATIGYIVVRIGSTLELVVVGDPAGTPVPGSKIAAITKLTAARAEEGLTHKPVA